jgi:hypothetical protein
LVYQLESMSESVLAHLLEPQRVYWTEYAMDEAWGQVSEVVSAER